MAIGTALAAVGGIASAAMGASASKKAANAQAESAEKSIQFQRDVVTQSRIDAYPWALEGATALYMYMDELGIPRPKTPILPDLTQGPFGVGGQAQAAAQPQQPLAPAQNPRNNGIGNYATSEPSDRQPNMMPTQQTAAASNAMPSPYKPPNDIPMTAQRGFRETPGYQFRVAEGQKGVLNNLSALGMKNSGRALKSLEAFSQGLASEEYGGWLNRIAGVAGMGQTQTNTNNAQMQNAGQNIGATMQDAGAARASGYMGAANAWQGGFNQLGNALGQMSTGGGFFGSGWRPNTTAGLVG